MIYMLATSAIRFLSLRLAKQSLESMRRLIEIDLAYGMTEMIRDLKNITGKNNTDFSSQTSRLYTTLEEEIFSGV